MVMAISVVHVMRTIMMPFVNDDRRGANGRRVIDDRRRCAKNRPRRDAHWSGSDMNHGRGDIDRRRHGQTNAEAERNARVRRGDARGTKGDGC